jgi:hypothetical protein
MKRQTWTLLLGAFGLFSGGCLEMDTHIGLQPDGSAIITEKVRFSQQLLDLGKGEAGGGRLVERLSRDAAETRMKHMGKGIRLVRHEVRDAEGGARESLAVFSIPDLNDLQYASPFLAYTDYAENNIVQVRMEPLLKSRNYAGKAGEMAVAFRLRKPPRAEPRASDATVPAGPSPLELQVLRQLQPVFADLLKKFKLRLTFETYAPIETTGFGLRDRRARPHAVDLIHVTEKDLDRFGVRFLENEEIMLDLLRGRLGSETICDTVRGFQDNSTVPIFLPWGSAHAPWRQSDEICFKPSKELFDRHFQGKMLNFDRWASTGKNLHPARWEEIGYQPKKESK